MYNKYQFVYPSSKESELISTAPFRAGVFNDNQLEPEYIEVPRTKKGR